MSVRRVLMLVSIAAAGCWRADLYPLSSGSLPDAGSAQGEAIYVSPAGDDANPGTLSQPLRTVARARDLVRARTAAMAADITVYLRGGTYPQGAPLTFANADSGRGGFYVKYVAYPGERPLITGGRPVTGWKISDATNGIYSATAGSPPFRQLYVNGGKAIRARSPNLGPGGAANFNRLSGYDLGAHNVQVASSYVANWSNLAKVEMHLMAAWSDNTLRIASVSVSGPTATIKFQSPEDGIFFVRPHPKIDELHTGVAAAFYFENALELLDQPGEWYLDETAGVVYYKPRPGEDMTTATVVAPMLETVVSVTGASTSEPVGYLWFQGLTFAHSSYLRPNSSGFLDAQAGQYNLTATADNQQTVGRPAAAVTITNAHHLHFERNLFTQMAATGLDFVSGTHDDTIVGNVFTQIGGSGLSVGKFTADEATEYHVPYNPSDKTEICTRETIRDNYIANVATEIQGACGIACGYPRFIDIEYNEVTATSFSGISVGYGWTASTNAMSNNKIAYNNIHDIGQILAGAAGISTLSNQGPASQIEYNFLHDFGASAWADYPGQGLFLDEGTTGYTVAHNVLQSTPGFLISQSAGANTLTDNGASPNGAEDIKASAGIEPSYADIKTLSIPPY